MPVFQSLSLSSQVPGYRYILYSEGSYETVYSLQNMHLFPLIEFTLTMNWQDGWTALMLAAQDGHFNVVETLLQHGASVDKKTTVSAQLTLYLSQACGTPQAPNDIVV